MSAVNLDNGMAEYFHGKSKANEDEDDEVEETNVNIKDKKIKKIKYDDIEIDSLLFQDDIAHCSETINDAQLVNDKIQDMLETKLLTMNADKSSFIFAGSKKGRKKMQEKLHENPIELKNGNMKQSSEEKYLGISRLKSFLKKMVWQTI